MKTRFLHFFLTLCLLVGFGLVYGQSWTGQYHCNETPDEAYPVWEKGDFNHPDGFLDPPEIWQDTSKSAFWEVIDDPNSDDDWIGATTFTSQERGDTLRKRESWIMNFDDADTNKADESFTVVIKTKPTQEILDAYAADPSLKYMYAYVSYRNKKNKCEIQWDTNGIKVNNDGDDIVVPVSTDEFHVFRFITWLDGDDQKYEVYVDEGSTPTLEGIISKSDKTRYLKFGSKSSSTNFGGIVDYIYWSVEGAYTPSELPVVGEPSAIKKIDNNDFSLASYPNPFENETQIKFEVKHTGYTTLDIYDMTGRKVETLVSEVLTPGEYEANFDGSEYAGGLYIGRLTSGNSSSSVKLMLRK